MQLSSNRFFIILVTIALFALASSALARTLYVSPVGSDLNDGSSWMRAKRSVSAALEAARAGDQIWVRYGVYYERITLKDGVSLYGGFRGIERTLSERPPFPRPSPDQYETVLDGRQGGTVVTTPSSASQTYRLDGFKVRNGKSTLGGGLYCTGEAASRLVVANCTFVGNSAESGGAIYCYNSGSLLLTNCTILQNKADLYGGGIFCDYFSYPTITDCTITQNIAGDSGGAVFACSSLTLTNCGINENQATNYGGGVHCYYFSSPILNNCTVNTNMARLGGGVYCDYFSSPALNNCTVSANGAYKGGGIYCGDLSYPELNGSTVSANGAYKGGGIYCGDLSYPELNGSTISDNRAVDGGGGILCDYYSYVLVTDCTISRNAAAQGAGGGIYCSDSSFSVLTRCTIRENRGAYGGGLYCYQSSPTLAECTIRENRGEDGGGLYCYYSSPTLTNCTISGNTATYRGGGGLYCYYSSPTLTNCTISGNTATYRGGGGLYCYYSSPTLTNCTINGNTAEFNGGGVYCEGSAIAACTISGNRARVGGGVYCSDSVITGCTISGNMARWGGGVYCRGDHSTLASCTISGNTAEFNGGGVYCYSSGSLTLRNCIISRNTANAGGAVYAGWYDSQYAHVTVTNCTICYNSARPFGTGGIAAYRLTAINTIVAFNSGGIWSGAPATLRHNCVWGNDAYNYLGMPDPTGTDGNISADPLMAGYHLLPGSPCIDAGDDSAIGIDWTDFDGEARIGGNRVDIGADEFHPPIVQGWMRFSDYVGTPPLWVPFEVRADSTTTQPVLIAPDGSFVVPGVPVGQFALSVKPLSYLRRTAEVDTTWGSVRGLRLELVNGDIDGDNEVTLFDFGRLVAAFGSAPGDANWDENADLDGDREVTLFDFGILVRNFGEMGDD